MGRISIPVDLMEILALAWDHPLIAGVMMLMFTPPFFPVLVFFSPLLISTTLCAVALISVGQQIEDASKREREVAGWNARGAGDGEALAVRERTIRRRRVPGEDNWLDWVRGFEPGSVWQTESTFMEDVKEERLLADFRIDEGGIDMKEEDFRQQIEAFREFERNLGERSFSFRTGAAAAASATMEALESPTADSSMRIVPFQNASTEVQAPPTPQIPSMFLYTLKTGGTGTGNANSIPALPAGQRTPRRSPQQMQQLLGGGQPQQPQQLQQREAEQQQQQQKTLVSFGSGFFAGNFDESETDNHLRPTPQPAQEQQPQQQDGLISFGSGFISGSYVDPKKELNQRRQQQQQGALLSFGSGFIAGNFVEPENDNQHQQQQQQLQQQQPHLQPRSTSFEMHVSSAEPAHSPRPVANTSLTSQNSIKSAYADHREHREHRENRESDRKTSIFGGFGGDSHARDSQSRPSHERFKALTYNASLIPGNAVIYTADPLPIDTKLLRRNSLSNRERRASSTASRQKWKLGAREMAARHALQVENSVSGDWMGMTTNAAR